MTPLKIMVLFEFPTLNGGEHSMLSCLKQLTQAGSNNTFLEFCAAGPASGPLAEQLLDLNVPLSKFETHNSAGIKYSPAQLQDQMQSVLKAVKPDVVHSNSLSMSRNVGRMSDELFHATLRTGHLRDIIKLSGAAINDLNRNDGLVAVSNATRDFHVSRGLSSNTCQTIYNGVDTELFSAKDAQSDRTEHLSKLSSDAIVVLNVGQICLRKGQTDLAKAIVNLLPKHPELQMVFAGSRHSQKAESIQYEMSIYEAFSDHGFEDHLHCLGYQPDIRGLMNAADVLVHAAKQEPLGRVLLEAAACELPIIATDVGGTSEIVTNQQDATLASPDTDSIQAAIGHFLDHRDAASARAKTARKRMLDRFSIELAAGQLADFWRQFQSQSQAN